MATWNAFSSSPYTWELKEDGFHFKGLKSYDGSSLLKLSFGTIFRYELHANRIPRPNRPPWRSAPHVELFGKLSGHTTAYDEFAGDKWSKCWMIRRQTLYQLVFAPPGTDNKRKIGEEVAVERLIFIEGHSGFQEVSLTGFQPMPPVVLNEIFPGLSIWAELEVRFDIQLEGDSGLWIDPKKDILIRGFQWPLEAI